MVQKFATKYTPRQTVGFKCDDVSLTEQCFKDECDINNIVRKPNLGINPFCPNIRQGVYGDFSDRKTFQDAMNIVATATQQFEQLPSTLRRRFNDNPSEFLEFVSNPDNIEEGKKLGIFVDTDIKEVVSEVAKVDTDPSIAVESTESKE